MQARTVIDEHTMFTIIQIVELQLFVNQKEPENLTNNSNDNNDVNDVNVHSSLNNVTSEISICKNMIIPVFMNKYEGSEYLS